MNNEDNIVCESYQWMNDLMILLCEPDQCVWATTRTIDNYYYYYEDNVCVIH